jgi:hypothetical protein
MNAGRRSPLIDDYLVVRAEASATGANAHAVHALLGTYYELASFAMADPACAVRLAIVERKLRSFCAAGLATAADATSSDLARCANDLPRSPAR